MKLGPEHIGKTMQMEGWDQTDWFIPTKLEGRLWYGMGDCGYGVTYHCDLDGWEEYAVGNEEPLKGLTLAEAMASGKPFRPVGGRWLPDGENVCWFTMVYDEEQASEVMVADGAASPIAVSLQVLSASYELKPESAPKKIEVTAIQLRNAFNKHKSNLIATESGCCGQKHLSVANDGVLFRKMLLDLGFTDKEITEVW